MSIAKSSIYTRTGDGGTSSLYNGERRSKTDLIFNALGSLDELNSHIGVALALDWTFKLADGPCPPDELVRQLTDMQCRLLDIGSHIATPLTESSSEAQKARTKFDPSNVERLESNIDALDAALPPLTTFILPSGSPGAQLHVCRCVCRRAERDVIRVNEASPDSVATAVLRYLNRASDYFFVLARYVSHMKQDVETPYRPCRQQSQ